MYSKTIKLIVLLFISQGIVAQDITLNTGTIIEIYSTKIISSKNLKKGDKLNFYVKNNINDASNKRIIIAANTNVEAEIINASNAKAGGRKGSIDITVKEIKAVDGQSVPVFLDLNNQGEDMSDASKTIGLLLFWPALLSKGGEAVINIGTPIKVKTVQNVNFKKQNLQKNISDNRNIIYEELIKNQIENCGKKPKKPKRKANQKGDFKYKSSDEFILYKKRLREWKDCMPYQIKE
tara:strand:- start:1165 stop:1872 length:708 start_codon:yes stop_codon:yes gene_type:complete